MQMAANISRRMLIISWGIILSGLTALPAAHHAPATATPPSVGMNDSVSIKLRGRVMPRCDFSGSDAPITLGDAGVDAGRGQVKRNFEVNCNAPFVITMSSGYGGLKLAAAGFSADETLRYEASLRVITDRGQIILLTCDGNDLKSGGAYCTRSSGDDTAIAKDALLIVNWRAEKDLPSGIYSDELHLNFYVRD